MSANAEDLQEELKELATFLDDSYFGISFCEKQRNLLIELVVMKLRAMAKE